jgi:hypothetical protein
LFPFSSLPIPATHTSHVSSNSALPAQFEDIAYSPILLPNHMVQVSYGVLAMSCWILRMFQLMRRLLDLVITSIIAWGMQCRPQS